MKCYEQLYCNKFGKLNEIDKIFETQPRLTQEMENPNSLIIYYGD